MIHMRGLSVLLLGLLALVIGASLMVELASASADVNESRWTSFNSGSSLHSDSRLSKEGLQSARSAPIMRGCRSCGDVAVFDGASGLSHSWTELFVGRIVEGRIAGSTPAT